MSLGAMVGWALARDLRLEATLARFERLAAFSSTALAPGE
jgi:hypothetical protein